MTTISNKDKSISINYDTPIEKKEVVKKETKYKVVLPEVTCDNEDDAVQIHMKVCEYVSTLVKDLLK